MFDPEAFLDLANQVTKLKMWPYFDIAHVMMCCLAVREDLGSGKMRNFSLFSVKLAILTSTYRLLFLIYDLRCRLSFIQIYFWPSQLKLLGYF